MNHFQVNVLLVIATVRSTYWTICVANGGMSCVSIFASLRIRCIFGPLASQLKGEQGVQEPKPHHRGIESPFPII